ncbi:MAG TPA: GntR family transcriptional regulator [Actinobacteria bacterium]|nr:GntR family transcriptional regulator [Actinomycetota bacterium]
MTTESHGNRLDPHLARYAQRTHSMTASEIRSLFAVASRPEVVSLAGGMPNIAALSMDVVSRSVTEMLAKRGQVALQYGSGNGDPRLREQICDIVALQGITTHPDDVVVTVGSQMALDLVTRIFCDPGDVIVAEAPSYVGALGVFRAYQVGVEHVAMDEHGLEPTALRERLETLAAQGRTPKFVYTIPTFHNPAGLSQPQQRRAEILQICQSAGVLVIEDDPYGLLGFEGSIPEAIRAHDSDGVIYLGSFSKTFAAGLRVGWAVAPHGVREKLTLAAEAAVLCPPAYSQLTISTYLETQPWMDQVKTFREVYRERRDAALESLAQFMPAGTTWTRPDGGFYVWVTLPDGIDATSMLPRAVTARVAYVPGTAFYIDGQGRQNLRISYCFPTPDAIREGVRRLGGVLEEELELLNTFGTTAGPAGSAPTDQAAAPGPQTL